MADGALKRKLKRMKTHGWFYTPDRPGDRTLAMQLEGLEPLLQEVQGKTVLDVGTAEGLIAMECAKRGAVYVRGVEIVPGHIEIANKLKAALPCSFEVADANAFEPDETFDVVMLLAVLHKLRDPSAACLRFARAARDLCVIRLSPTGSDVIEDARSSFVPHDIGAVMRTQGFVVERRERGPLGEITWYHRRQFYPE